MLNLKSLIVILSIGAVFASCERDSDIFPDIDKGANVRMVKSPDFDGFVNATDISGSTVAVDIFSDDPSGIEKVELSIGYTSGALDSVFPDALIATLTPSDVSNGRFPAQRYSTQDIADAVGISLSDMNAGDVIEVKNKTTMTDGRVFPSNVALNDSTVIRNIAPSIEQGNAASFTEKLVYFIACPFNADDAVGDYLITRDDFDTSLDYDTPIKCVKLVTDGTPSDNIVVFENLFMHPEMFNVSVQVNLSSGEAVVQRQPAWHCDNFGCNFGEGRVNGSGFFLSCVGFVTLDLQHTVDAGSFGTFRLELQKQP